MNDGFYRIRHKKSNSWHSIGELRTVEEIQMLYLVGFDEPVDPDDFIIHPIRIFMELAV